MLQKLFREVNEIVTKLGEISSRDTTKKTANKTLCSVVSYFDRSQEYIKYE